MFVPTLCANTLCQGRALTAMMAKGGTYWNRRVLNDYYSTGALWGSYPNSNIVNQLGGNVNSLFLEPFFLNMSPPAMIELPCWDLVSWRSCGKFCGLLLVHFWWEVHPATHGSSSILGHPDVPGKGHWATRKKNRWRNQMRILEKNVWALFSHLDSIYSMNWSWIINIFFTTKLILPMWSLVALWAWVPRITARWIILGLVATARKVWFLTEQPRSSLMPFYAYVRYMALIIRPLRWGLAYLSGA